MSDVEATSDAVAARPGPVTPEVGRRRGRRPDAALVGVGLLGVVLRFWGIGDQSIWYDEWFTVKATSSSPVGLVRHVATVEGVGPVYFGALWLWARVVGDGDAALRAFSALAGAATVPVAWAIARELGRPRRVAVGAALLVAANPMLVWYSQEAGPYSRRARAGGGSGRAAGRADRAARRADALWWGAAAAVAVAVHWFALFLVVGEAAGLVLRRRLSRRALAAGVAPLALTLLALAPLFVVQRRHGSNQGWITAFGLRGRVEEAVRIVAAGPSPFAHGHWLAVLGGLALAGVPPGASLDRDDRRAVLALGGVATVAVGLPFVALALGTDAIIGRYLLGAVVPLLVGIAVALLAPTRPWPGAIAVAAVVALWVASDVATVRDPVRQRPDWRAIAEVAATGDPATVLVVDSHGALSLPLARYLPDGEVLSEDRTVAVTEIDVLLPRRSRVPCDFLVGRACALLFLGAAASPVPNGSFRLAERVLLDQFVVERYRSDRPVRMGRGDLLAP